VGDTAILLGLLRAIGLTGVKTEVTVLSMGPIDMSRDAGLIGQTQVPRLIRANARRFEELPVLRSLIWRAGRWVPYGRWLEPINVGRCRSILKHQDMLIIGGGNLLKDLYEGNVRILETVCNAARAAGVPYAFLGVGAGPINSADSRKRLGACLASAEAVLVRDAASRDLCCDVLGRRDTLRSPDLAFALQGVLPTARRRRALAINLASYGDQTWPWQDESKYTAYLEGFIRLARAAAQRLKPDRLNIISTNMRVDHRATREVAAALGRGSAALDCPVSVVPCADVTGAVGAFSSAGMAITTRLHAGILAGIAGCRVLPVVYDNKVRAVLEEEGVSQTSIDLADLADLAWSPDCSIAVTAEASAGLSRAIASEVTGDVEKLLKQSC
jgi:polysaccharide pyruvyl transferase WcaK-like protein